MNTERPKPFGQRATASIFWLVIERVIKLCGAIVVGGMIARHLGPDDYGRYGAALGLATLAKEFVVLGLDRIIRRELCLKPGDTGRLVGTAVTTALTLAFIVALVLTALAHAYIADPGTRRIAMLLVWMALPQAFYAGELWFESQCNTRPLVWARNAVWLTFQAARLLLIWLNADLMGFALVACAEWAVTYAAVVWIFHRHTGPQTHLEFAPPVLRQWIREGWPLIVMLVIGSTADRLMVLLLQHLTTSEEAGYLSAALRITEVWWSLSALIASVILPVLTRHRVENEQAFNQGLRQYADCSLLLGTVAAVAMTFAAPFIVPLVFGAKFAPAAPVLSVLFWAGPAIYPGVARSQILLISGKQTLEIPVVAALAIFSVVLVACLAPAFGALGAAIGITVAQWLAIYGVAALAPRLRQASLPQWRAFSIPWRWRALWNELRALAVTANLLRS